MRTLICQICDMKTDESDLFDHLVDKHGWQINSVSKLADMPEPNPNAVGETKRPNERKKKTRNAQWQESPELLTCPHCSQRFKRKQTLIEHVKRCPQKHSAKPAVQKSPKESQHSYSYKWGYAQPLEKRHEPTVSKLVSEKSIDYLTKEIESILASLQSSPDNELSVGRLIIFSKAKQRALKAERRAKNKKRKHKVECKVDALDRRVPGSYGSGRN